jgi:hypothetical protein
MQTNSTTVLALGALLWATPAPAYTDAQYCVDTLRAERMYCHAAHLEALAQCASDRAFDLWIDTDDAVAQATDCRADADAACVECKADVACDTGVIQ